MDFEVEKVAKDLESRILSLGHRIANFADLQTKYDNLESLVQFLAKKLQETESVLYSEQECRKKEADSDYKTHEYLQKQISENFKDFKTETSKQDFLFGSIHDLKTQKEDLLHKLNTQDQKLESFKETVKQVVEKSSKVFEEFEKFLLNYFEDFKKFDEIQKNIQVLQQNYLELQNNQLSIDKKVAKIFEDVLDGQVHNQAQIALVSQKVDEKFKEIILQIQSKFADIKIPEINHFVTDSDLHDLKHKIEVSHLDSKNASDRSVATEMQLQLLSKKIEGIAIQLKTQEMRPQH